MADIVAPLRDAVAFEDRTILQYGASQLATAANLPIAANLLGGFIPVTAGAGNRIVMRNRSNYRCRVLGIRLVFAPTLSAQSDGWHTSVSIPIETMGWSTEASGLITLNGVTRKFSVGKEEEYFFPDNLFNEFAITGFTYFGRTFPRDYWQYLVDPSAGSDQVVHFPNTSLGQLNLGFIAKVTLYK